MSIIQKIKELKWIKINLFLLIATSYHLVLAADVTYNKEGEIVNINPVETRPAEMYYHEESNQSNLPKGQPIIKKPIEIPIPKKTIEQSIKKSISQESVPFDCRNMLSKTYEKQLVLSKIFSDISAVLSSLNWNQDRQYMSLTGKWKEISELNMWLEYISKNSFRLNYQQCYDISNKMNSMYEILTLINSENLDVIYRTQARSMNIISESMCNTKENCSKIHNNITNDSFIKNYNQYRFQTDKNISELRESLQIFSL